MATKDEREQIAVLQTQMTEVLRRLDGIDKKLDAQNTTFSATYATQQQITALEQQHKALADKIQDLGKFNWLTHSLTAALSASLAALLFWFFNHGGAR